MVNDSSVNNNDLEENSICKKQKVFEHNLLGKFEIIKSFLKLNENIFVGNIDESISVLKITPCEIDVNNFIKADHKINVQNDIYYTGFANVDLKFNLNLIKNVEKIPSEGRKYIKESYEEYLLKEFIVKEGNEENLKFENEDFKIFAMENYVLTIFKTDKGFRDYENSIDVLIKAKEESLKIWNEISNNSVDGISYLNYTGERNTMHFFTGPIIGEGPILLDNYIKNLKLDINYYKSTYNYMGYL